MGIVNDKKNVFNQIGALTSIKNNQNTLNTNSSLSSVNNTREIIPFLLDILVVLVGSQVLKTLIGELLTNYLRNVEPILKLELKKQTIDYNSGNQLPAYFNSTGISVDGKDIDVFGKLKTNPSSAVGLLLYDSSTSNFDRTSYSAILLGGSAIPYNQITISYNSTLNGFNYKPTNPNQTIGQFTNSYIDSIQIVDEKEFITNILNNIFGVVSTNQNKSLNELINEEKVNKTIEKVINEENDLSINNNELRELQLNAQKKKQGLQTVDVGCGIINNVLTIESVTNTVNNILNSTSPLEVGNQFNGLIDDGFNNNDPRVADNNETIKDGFFKRLINSIVFVLVSAIVTTPQIRALFGITSAFKNNGSPDISDPVQDIIKRKKLVDCLAKEVKKTINEFIFNTVKTQILALIIPASKIILKEKINQYLGILKSLIR